MKPPRQPDPKAMSILANITLDDLHAKKAPAREEKEESSDSDFDDDDDGQRQR